jgi:hypothetical protein
MKNHYFILLFVLFQLILVNCEKEAISDIVVSIDDGQSSIEVFKSKENDLIINGSKKHDTKKLKISFLLNQFEMNDSLINFKEEMISSIDKIKKETDDNFKNLKLEMTSSVNELKKEIVSTFKKLNPLPFGTPYGIQNNIHVSKLTESGYSYVYNKPYSHVTTSSEMDEIKESCLPTTNLCIGYS